MYKLYGIITLVLAVLAKFVLLYNEIDGLHTDIDSKDKSIQLYQQQIGKLKADNQLLNKELDDVNKAIEAISIQYVDNINELDKWKHKPAKVKYKTVYKIKKEIKYETKTCEYGKELNKAIANLSYSDL